LQSGIERGYFSSQPQPQSRPRADAPNYNQTNVGVVVAVAAEVASAMAYLHSRNVVHGDLCGSNVMLTTDKGKPAGFTAKVLLVERSTNAPDATLRTSGVSPDMMLHMSTPGWHLAGLGLWSQITARRPAADRS
jgi:serine/threonine protein kinase